MFLQVFLEQKKMFKNGLNMARFKEYVPIIEQEARDYLSRWGDSGEVSTYIIPYISSYSISCNTSSVPGNSSYSVVHSR